MFVFIHLREKVFIFKYDLFRFFIGKKFCRCCSETLNDIEQCSNRRRVLVAFQLGDKSLGKLRTVGKFLLRQSCLLYTSDAADE